MKNLKGFKSIKYKFLFSSLLLIITYMIFTAYIWYSKTSHDATESSATYLSEMLRVSNDNFEVALRDINYLVSSAAREDEYVKSILSKPLDSYTSGYDLLLDNRKLQNYITNSTGYKHYLSGIMISSLEGRYFTNGDMVTFDAVVSQYWYKNLSKAQNQSIFIPPHTYAQNDNNISKNTDKVFSIVRPVFMYNTMIGFVLADINSNLLQDIYDINLKGKGTIVIFDTNTESLIFEPDNSKLSISTDDLGLLAQKFKSDQGTIYSKVGNRNMLVIYNYSSLTKWTTIGLIPVDEMMSSYNSILKAILLILLLFMIIGIIVTYLTSFVLTKDILRLNNALKTVGKDNMDISITIKSNDEINQLYHQFNSMVVRIKNLVNEIKSTEAAKRKAELKALQSQINPHFLYNTLNTIKFLSTMYGADNIQEVSESLSRLMHITMDNRTFIRVEEEIQYIESYLKIQEYKYTGKFEYSIKVDEDLADYYVLKLLLQPIVENALIHGIAPMKGHGIILIRIYRDSNCLKLRIQDNGIGMDKKQIEELLDSTTQKRIGLRNVINRIKLNFGADFGVSISSEEKLFTIVEITVPLITENEVIMYA